MNGGWLFGSRSQSTFQRLRRSGKSPCPGNSLGIWKALSMKEDDRVIFFANVCQAALAHTILSEAADWLAARGDPLWRNEEISKDDINAHAKVRELVIG